jgi:hypothetical protein
VVLLLAIGLLAGSTASAQDAEPTYVILDCMKSTGSNYADVETEVWKPMHQELVNQGKKIQWALYWVLFGDRSVCDYYTVNVVTESQLNATGGFNEVFAAVHPDKDVNEVMSETAAARQMVWTELWQIHETVPSTDFAYVQINHFAASDAGEYVALEREYSKPVHEALVEDGVSAGWGLYSLSSPHGEQIPYTHGTADFMTTLTGFPFWQYLQKVHDGKDLDELANRFNDARDVVSSEIWTLIDRTAPAE